MRIEDILKKERSRLYRGCGGHESYWGHTCKSTFVNTSNKKVTVYCDRCEAQLELIKKITKLLKQSDACLKGGKK